MHYHIGLLCIENRFKSTTAANVSAIELVTIRRFNVDQRKQVTCIGQRIDVDYTVVGTLNDMTDDDAVNKTSTTRN